MISQAIDFLRSHPNKPFSLSEIANANQTRELTDTELVYIQADLFYHFQKLITQQPYQWRSTMETPPKFYYTQHRVTSSEDLLHILDSFHEKTERSTNETPAGFPASVFDMRDKTTKDVIYDALETKSLQFITPGCPPPPRAPARLTQSHPSLKVQSFTSTIGVSPEKGIIEVKVDPSVQCALCTIKVRASNPKVQIAPLLEDVKPGGFARFTVEGKEASECVLRVSLDAADRLVLPLKITSKVLKPESRLFSTKALRGVTTPDVDLVYQWHVLSNGYDDEKLKLKEYCSKTYIAPKDDSKSIVPEEAQNAFTPFQRPPTNIHMRLFHPKLLRICKPE